MRRGLSTLLSLVLLAGVLVGGAAVSPASAAASCDPVDPSALAFDAPDVVLPVGTALACLELPLAAGDTVYAGVTPSTIGSVTFRDGSGTEICGAPSILESALTCHLAGQGPFTLTVVNTWPDEQEGAFKVFEISHAAGCPQLTPASFGDPGSASDAISLANVNVDCRVADVTGVQVGLGVMDASTLPDQSGGSFVVDLYDNTGDLLCHETVTAVCSLPAPGRVVAVLTKPTYGGDGSGRLSVVSLDQSTSGCTTDLNQDWDGPIGTIQSLQQGWVGCETTSAVEGDSIYVDSPDYWKLTTAVVDATGADACASGTDLKVCRLTGAAPFRVVHYAKAGYDLLDGADVAARRLNNPVGCLALSPNPWDSAPVDGSASQACRTITVAAPMNAFIRMSVGHRRAFGPSGTDECGDVCALETGTSVVFASPFVAGFTTVFHDLSAVDGCAASPDDVLHPMEGALAAPQVACYTLPSSPGDVVTLVAPNGGPGLGTNAALYDGDGNFLCRPTEENSGSATSSHCTLSGATPYKAVVFPPSSGSYAMVVANLTSPGGCTDAPISSYQDQTGQRVDLDASTWVRCVSVPAITAGSQRLLSYERVSGSGSLEMTMTSKGTHYSADCKTNNDFQAVVMCGYRANEPNARQVFLVGDRSAATTFRFFNRGVGQQAVGCQQVTQTDPGSPALTATRDSFADALCFELQTDSVDDRYFLVAGEDRYGTTTRFFDDSANAVCSWTRACDVSGSTGYQTIVWDRDNGDAPSAEVFSAVRLDSPDGFGARCATYDDYSAGVGPLDVFLDGTTGAECVFLPAAYSAPYFDTYTVDLVQSDPSLPLPGMSVLAEGSPIGVGQYCTDTSSTTTQYTCTRLQTQLDSGLYSQRAVLVFARGTTTGPAAAQVTVSCVSSNPCGRTYRVTSMSPASAPAGVDTDVVVDGYDLPGGTGYRLVRDGYEDIVSTASSGTSSERTVTFPLASAATGDWTLVVDSPSYGRSIYSVPFNVTQPEVTMKVEPMVIPAPPAVDKTLEVYGGEWSLPVDDTTYQWFLDGVAVDGATGQTFALTPDMLGHDVGVEASAVREGAVVGVWGHDSGSVRKGAPPVAQTAPRIRGRHRVGRVVRIKPGVWSPTANSYSFRWFKDGRLIKSAKGRRLRLRRTMVNHRISAKVIAHRAGCRNGHARTAAFRVRR